MKVRDKRSSSQTHNEAGKAYYLAPTAATPVPVADTEQNKKRGINVYHISQLLQVTGKTQSGGEMTGSVEQPIYGLTIDQRVEIFQYSTPVFGVVTSRMNRISGLDYKVIPDSESEDLIVAELRNLKAIADEYEQVDDLQFQVTRGQIINIIRQKLTEMTPNLSNFDTALLRWSRNLALQKTNVAHEIEEWLSQPNPDDDWTDFIKKYVADYMVHGTTAIYKKAGEETYIETLHILPGGTVYPFRLPFVSDVIGYVQYVEGFIPQIYFNNEIALDTYIPASFSSYGMVPLDCLVNKVAEGLLFDRLMAEQADGTKPPEKIVVFSDPDPIGDLSEQIGMAVDSSEQQRIEQKFNEAREGAIATMTGKGNVAILDLTRENTMATQMERQTELKKDIALAFNMSNVEINETGSGDTSGRATSESQERIEQAKGTGPLIKAIQNTFTTEVIPFRYGYGYSLKLQTGVDEFAEIRKAREMLESKLYDVNWIRVNILNLPPYEGEEFNKPQGAAQPLPPMEPAGSFF